MSARRTGIAALVAVVIIPITARAADVPVIRVFPPQCEAAPLSVDDFVDSLRVELAGRQPHCCVVGPSGDGAADAVRVALSIEPCDAATLQVGITVDVTDPPRTVERQVSLADLPPEARPRALALAVAELIRSAGGSAQPDAGALPPDHPPVVPPPRGLLVTGGVAGEVRRHFSRDTTLWGPRLALSLSATRWQVTLDAGAATNSTQVSLGELSILIASAALFAGPRLVLGPVVTSVGPAASLGWARIKGQSDMTNIVPASGSNLVSTLGLRVAVEGPASSVIRLFGYAEGGFTLLGLNAVVDGRLATGVSGPYLMLAVGGRFGPAG